jgi:hypothetical protein
VSEKPNPDNSPALRELHHFVDGWVRRHGLDRLHEHHLFAHYLACRLDVSVALEKCRAWEPDPEPCETCDDDGGPCSRCGGPTEDGDMKLPAIKPRTERWDGARWREVPFALVLPGMRIRFDDLPGEWTPVVEWQPGDQIRDVRPWNGA